MRYLVTGAAGFIGFHVAKELLRRGDTVVGIDNLNDYYDVGLKRARLEQLAGVPEFENVFLDIADRSAMESLFARSSFDVVIHLAAQAGVRYSLKAPHTYVDANLVGFVNILEGCRHAGVGHLVYASSSSVYGGNTSQPFSVHDNVDHPLSLYAATKKANELLAHSYSHLYRIPTTGLRFFTVYGPWGRPDMALYIFADAILRDQPIQLFNHGDMRRDFTYVDDIVRGVLATAALVAAPSPEFDPRQPDPASSNAPFRVFNIGNNRPVELRRLVEVLEASLGRQARIELAPMQPGDVPETSADIDALTAATGFTPNTPIEVGVPRFAEWFLEYRKRAT